MSCKVPHGYLRPYTKLNVKKNYQFLYCRCVIAAVISGSILFGNISFVFLTGWSLK